MTPMDFNLPATSRFASWTVDENAALYKIVKKVQDDRASAPVGDKHTSTFWEAVAAAVEVQMPGRGARAQGHYRDYRAELAKNLPAGEFDDLAGHLKKVKEKVPSPAGEKIDAPEASPQRELLRQKMAQKGAARTIACFVGEESKTASGKRTMKENERTTQKTSTAPPQEERRETENWVVWKRPALRRLNASAAPRP